MTPQRQNAAGLTGRSSTSNINDPRSSRGRPEDVTAQEARVRTLVAIPIFNEIKYVQHVLDSVRQYHDDILFVDDYSTDGTGEFLARQGGIHLVRHDVNGGYGSSIIDAFKFAAARGFDWVITLDADEQHEPRMIPHFKKLIETDQYDLISGTRYTGETRNDDLAPGDRRQINVTITQLVNDCFNWSLTDTFCGYKAHRVSATQSLGLTETGYAFPLQLWPRVFEHNLRMTELSVKRIYHDPNRTFGGGLDDARLRLKHYLGVFKAELRRMKHLCSEQVDQITLENSKIPCGCC
jgi:glycosyltransferase involved in cell wall biosynthesis